VNESHTIVQVLECVWYTNWQFLGEKKQDIAWNALAVNSLSQWAEYLQFITFFSLVFMPNKLFRTPNLGILTKDSHQVTFLNSETAHSSALLPQITPLSNPQLLIWLVVEKRRNRMSSRTKTKLISLGFYWIFSSPVFSLSVSINPKICISFPPTQVSVNPSLHFGVTDSARQKRRLPFSSAQILTLVTGIFPQGLLFFESNQVRTVSIFQGVSFAQVFHQNPYAPLLSPFHTLHATSVLFLGAFRKTAKSDY
jgi:hypothetical protein